MASRPSSTDGSDSSVPLTRRQLLRGGLAAGGGLVLGGCALNGLGPEVAEASGPINERIEAWLQSKGPVPEFSRHQVQPEELLINSFNGQPNLDPATYRLTVTGLVAKPLQLNLAALADLPQRECIIRHVCVEGWSAIVAWGGVRLADVLQMAEVSNLAHYVYFDSADGYYESWDMASAFHPQTLLVTHMNGAPLPAQNGAPVRLASPLKLGYKNSKWVVGIRVASTLETERKGYWEDQGYEWYAGL
ncbi:MAG: molybdopterin-dependent oxidoreductase [Cyanobacteriota bacterium]|nr:molybdopterin-dependent oxidoreductase [Cyanobacteriota bacterium]